MCLMIFSVKQFKDLHNVIITIITNNYIIDHRKKVIIKFFSYIFYTLNKIFKLASYNATQRIDNKDSLLMTY